MHTLRLLTLLLAVALGANSAQAQSAPVPGEPRVLSGGLACETLDGLKQAIDEIMDESKPYPKGCFLLKPERAAFGSVIPLGEYEAGGIIYYLARFEFTHAVTPMGLMPFNEGTAIRYGVWSKEEKLGLAT